jgi:hypothetical protein
MQIIQENHAFRLGRAMRALADAVNDEAYQVLQQMAIDRASHMPNGNLSPYGIKQCADYLEAALAQIKTVARAAVRDHAVRDPYMVVEQHEEDTLLDHLRDRLYTMQWTREDNSKTQKRRTVEQVMQTVIIRGVPAEMDALNSYGETGLVIEVTYAEVWRALYEVRHLARAILWAD